MCFKKYIILHQDVIGQDFDNTYLCVQVYRSSAFLVVHKQWKNQQIWKRGVQIVTRP